MKLPAQLEWLVEALATVMMVGLCATLAAGLLLLMAPHVLAAVNLRMSRWVDTRDLFRVLEHPRELERFFYRHHRTLGALIVAGASYVLLRWWFAFDRDAFVRVIDRWWRSSGLDFLVPAIESIIVGFHLAILMVGLVIFLRPSLLKVIERHGNRWHHILPAERLDTIIGPLDESIVSHPRLAGLVISLASAWSLAMLIPPFFNLLSR
ncbi:MAG TPA: hypothetical protein VM240_05000 [Verrucomicrobiae bacterium]|nr:hypothetical protein [Verrucomicrobiae bacterium]